LSRLGTAGQPAREPQLPIRFHDLRHTIGHRLRAIGAPVEDRKALPGHTSGEITTHYSAAELGTLLKWAEAIVDARLGTALRTGFGANLVELRRKRGNLSR
jgi:integrase